MRTEFVRPTIPPVLLAPCPSKWAMAGGPAVTGDFVKRGDVNETGLDCREAKLDGIRKWNAAESTAGPQ